MLRHVPGLKQIAIVVLLLPGLLLSQVTLADSMEIEVIDLQHRPAQEVVPLVSPFVVKGGSITGTDFRLIVKSTPENIDQIRKLVSEVDTALRQLVLYISTDAAAVRAQQQAGVSGRVGNEHVQIKAGKAGENNKTIVVESGKSVHGGASAEFSSSSAGQQEPAAQKIRVQEGQWAVIRTGKAIPIAQRTTNPDGTVTQTITYRNVTTGFKVKPQVNGQLVNLHVMPEQASVNESGTGAINVSGLETTVHTRLDQWVELGGSVEGSQQQQRGITYSSSSQAEQQQRVFVKVVLQKLK
jgi:type II secretory pathway component GspD/PulD (secretin)